MLDYLSLIGDTSDNIPGVKGIGPKTAVKLLQDYGTLDAVYEHIDSIAEPYKRNWLPERRAPIFQKLITLAADIPIEGSIEDYRCDALHYPEAAALLKEYELPRLGNCTQRPPKKQAQPMQLPRRISQQPAVQRITVRQRTVPVQAMRVQNR